MADGESTSRTFCNNCGRKTNHCSREIHTYNYTDDDCNPPKPIHESWALLVCLGCERVRTRQTRSSPEDKAPTVAEFPPRQSRRTPSWRDNLPQEVRDMHREVYDALHAKAPCCATMGLRTLIDMTLTQLVGDLGNFTNKLAAAVQKGQLTPQHRKTLEAAIEAGSAAAHRGFTPNENQIEDVLGIVEHLLQGFYVLEQVSNRLREQIPPRAR